MPKKTNCTSFKSTFKSFTKVIYTLTDFECEKVFTSLVK